MRTACLCVCLFGVSMDAHLLSYFIDHRGACGAVRDRSSGPPVFSSAATGFGMAAWAVAYERGAMPRDRAIAWVHAALDFYDRTNPAENRGWLFHFVGPDGRPAIGSEVSTIDTALFYWGALDAAGRLRDPPLEARVRDALARIDLPLMIKGGRFRHGRLDGRPLEVTWDEWNEGVLLYELFDVPFTPTAIRTDLPLFVYYYPMCYLPLETGLLDRAVLHQLRAYGYWGVTSGDVPWGYDFNPVGFLSPPAVLSVYARHGVDVPWDGVHMRGPGWKSADRIGIDEGALLLLRDRYLRR